MARIAIDLDDTLLDFNSLARFRLAQLADERSDGRLRTAAYTPWDEWRSPNDLAGEDVWQEVIEWCHGEEQILSREPLPGSREALWDLHYAGHSLVYVSNRHPSTKEPTREWLYKHSFPIDVTDTSAASLVCHTDDKLASIRDCQYLIDDRPKTLVGFLYGAMDFIDAWQEAETTTGLGPKVTGRKAFGLVMPYNRNLTDVPGIYLAPSWPLLRPYLRDKIPPVVPSAI